MTAHVQGQWKLLQSNITNSLFDVHFVDENHGWVVGAAGTILKTTDGGKNWQSQTSGITNSITKVFFVDTLYGWVVSKPITLLHTTDGGNSWNKITETLNRPLSDVWFVNRNVGWVVGGLQLPDSPYGVILGTTDGGMSWNELIDSTKGVFQGIQFLNENEGWVVGGKTYFDNFDPDIILHTTNGGMDWTEQVTPTFGPLSLVYFLNNNTGWAGGSSFEGETVALRTTNGGLSWETVHFQLGPIVSNYPITGIASPDSNKIWLLRANELSYSADGGQTWTRKDPNESASAQGIFFFNPNHGWLVGTNGSIWKYSEPIVSVASFTVKPEATILEQNFPNPFNSATKIFFRLNEGGFLSMKVYNMLGLEVRTLANDFYHSGLHSVIFDANGLPTGTYYYKILINGKTQTNKMVYLK